MKSALDQLPARILKRADVSAGLAHALVPDAALSGPVAERAPTPSARHVAKEARLLPGTPGTAAVEVRCSCGEWTRIELCTGDGPKAEEQR